MKNSRSYTISLLPVIDDVRGGGLSALQQIDDALNERGITAARGGAWSTVQVRRILEISIGQKANAQHVTEDGSGTIAA